MTAEPPNGSATFSPALNHWRATIVAGLKSRAHGWLVSGPVRMPELVKFPQAEGSVISPAAIFTTGRAKVPLP